MPEADVDQQTVETLTAEQNHVTADPFVTAFRTGSCGSAGTHFNKHNTQAIPVSSIL